MDAYICNRCKRAVIRGEDRRIRIEKKIFSADGRLVLCTDLDLCPKCNEEFEEFLHNCDLGEITQNIPNFADAELDPATKNVTSKINAKDNPYTVTAGINSGKFSTLDSYFHATNQCKDDDE